MTVNRRSGPVFNVHRNNFTAAAVRRPSCRGGWYGVGVGAGGDGDGDGAGAGAVCHCRSYRSLHVVLVKIKTLVESNRIKKEKTYQGLETQMRLEFLLLDILDILDIICHPPPRCVFSLCRCVFSLRCCGVSTRRLSVVVFLSVVD
jgi:hypothetical protein